MHSRIQSLLCLVHTRLGTSVLVSPLNPINVRLIDLQEFFHSIQRIKSDSGVCRCVLGCELAQKCSRQIVHKLIQHVVCSGELLPSRLSLEWTPTQSHMTDLGLQKFGTKVCQPRLTGSSFSLCGVSREPVRAWNIPQKSEVASRAPAQRQTYHTCLQEPTLRPGTTGENDGQTWWWKFPSAEETWSAGIHPR